MPRGCLIVIAVVVLLFLGLPFVFNFLVDFLWFDSQAEDAANSYDGK